MRTTKMFTSVIAALSLMYSSGCCDSNCDSPRLAATDCQPVAYASMPTVTYEPVAVVADCPPPKAVKAKKPQRVRCSRQQVRTYVDPCNPCGPQYYPAVAYAGSTTLINNANYVSGVTYAAEPAPAVRKQTPPKGSLPVLQRGHRGRKVVDNCKPARVAKEARPVVYVAETKAAPAPFRAKDDYSITALSPSKSVEPAVEPIEAKAAEPEKEPAEKIVEKTPEPVVEQPAYAKYIDTSAPAVTLPASPMDPAQVAATLELTPGMILESPAPVAQPMQPMQPMQPIVQPVVIQPIIQPVMSPIHGAAQVQGQTAMPIVAPPTSGSWVEGGLVSSAYCPPNICPTPNTSLCAPGQNLSDCFTMSENQLLNSPQIFTPDAVNPLMPLVPAAPQVTPIPQTQQPQAQARPQAVPANAPAAPSKYAALTPPPDITRDARRPEVNMPTPLGGDNVPVVPGTAEIERMLDAMVPPPNLK